MRQLIQIFQHQYIAMNRLDEALIADNQAHDQLLKTLPYNHPEVLTIRESLDKIQMILMLREEQD